MSEEYRTKTGRILTDVDIEALADEAERGYDPSSFVARAVKTPLTDAVNLARKYTADEWREAAGRAADYNTEQVCRAMYQFRLADTVD